VSGLCECQDGYFGRDCSKKDFCEDNDGCGGDSKGTCDVSSGSCECIAP